MTHSRLAFRLALGILCGLVLVLLPAVFSVGTPSPAVNNTNSSSSTGFGPLRLPVSAPLASPSMVSAGTFLSIILFIFLPSTVFSVIVRSWVEKRARHE